MSKSICPFMSDSSIIRHCQGNCALQVKPTDGADGESECAFKIIGYVADMICAGDTIDSFTDCMDQLRYAIETKGKQHES